MICLKKASTKSTTIEKAQASCLGISKLLLANGGLDDEASTGDLLLLDSMAPTSDCRYRVYKTKRVEKQG